MGIYDREYYRDDSRGPGWFAGPNPAVRTIILINVLVFFLRVLFDPRDRIFDAFAADSDAIFHRFEIWRLLSSAFLHDSRNLFHIVWNMLFLWMIGRELEQQLGSREFTCMYLAACLFSMLGWAAVDILRPGRGPAIGASGAVMAVVTLFTLYYPRRELLLFFILPVPMWVALIVFLGQDLLGLLQVVQGGSSSSLRVAFMAHISGAIYGLLYWFFGIRWSRLLSFHWRFPWKKLRVVHPPAEPRERKRPLESVSTSRVASAGAGAGALKRTPGKPAISENELDERLDEILAKIAREGRDGLTDEEKGILQEASRRAQSRRKGRP
jgi:membrane associated rhomboid family serine protease